MRKALLHRAGRRVLNPAVLIIAGSDNSAKAGLEQDLRIAEYLGFGAVTVSTGRTLQSPDNGLEQTHSVSRRRFHKELEFAFARFDIKAIKIGALTRISQAKQLQRFLSAKGGQIPVVVDPVFKPTTGKPFIPEKQIPAYLKYLLSLSSVVTPNDIEAAIIAKNLNLHDSDITEALRRAAKKSGTSFFITGGHGPDNMELEDRLVTATDYHTFRHPRLRLSNTRGTGCAFSTALACRLSRGTDINGSAAAAIADVQNYLLYRDGMLSNSSTEPMP